MNKKQHLISMKWKVMCLFLIGSLTIAYSSHAQKNIISIERINKVKKGNFTTLSIEPEISNYSLVQISEFNTVLQQHSKRIKLHLRDVLPNDNTQLSDSIFLDVYNILSPHAMIVAGSKDRDRIIDTQFTTYRGKISEEGWINLTFSQNGVIGRINWNFKSYAIKPVSNSIEENKGKHIIYEISNQLTEEGRCGLVDQYLSPQLIEFMATLNTLTLKSANSQLTVKIAVETDYETYVSFGNDSLLTTAYLLTIISSVSQIFEQEVNINFEVAFSRVWTTPQDPYTTKGYSLHSEFQQYWNSNMQHVERDVALLIIKDPSRLSGGMGALDALCDKNRAFIISGENVLTVTHELGHIFGAPHTHNCYWPAGIDGTLAPIDKCATVEGDCGIDEIVLQEGTIMSYCSPKKEVFHPLVRNLIRAKAESNPCIGNGVESFNKVSGRVLLNGIGLANVYVEANQGDGKIITTTTNENGFYSMTLLNTNYNLSADFDGFLITPIGYSSSKNINVYVAGVDVTGVDFEAFELTADRYEADNDVVNANNIPNNGSIQYHTIHNDFDIDFISFNAVKGQIYSIIFHLDKISFLPNFNLLDTNGISVIANVYSTKYFEWKADKSGTYYIRIFGPMGFYGLSISSAAFLKEETAITPLKFSNADWGDYDNDEDFDLIVTGWFNSSKHSLDFFENEGGVFIKMDNGIKPFESSGILRASVKWGDFDNDGDLDLFVGENNKVYIAINTNGLFNEKIIVAENLSGICSVDFGDYDNDGDLDILVASRTDIRTYGDFPLLRLYENVDGNYLNTNLGLRGVDYGKIGWIDYDGDGDLDIFVTGASNQNGSGVSSSSSSPFTTIYKNENGNFYYTDFDIEPLADFPDFDFGDIDNDGDLDLVIAGFNGTKLITKIYLYDKANYSEYCDLVGIRNASIALGDYDNDGDLDLIISGLDRIDASASSSAKLFINENNTFEETPFSFGLPGITGEVNWCDYDNDNDLDLFLIGESSDRNGHVYLLRNETTTKNNRPSSPDNLNSNIDSSGVTLSWAKSQDDETPSMGLTYNLCIGTSPGSGDVLSPMSDLTTGRRKIVRIGNSGQIMQKTIYNLNPNTYYWRVQSIDNSFEGSAWSAEQSFTVPISTNLSKNTTQSDNLKFSIIPNPNNGKFILRFENGKQGKYNIQIINVLGQVRVEKEVYLIGNVQEEEFELSHLPKGNYFVKVFDGLSTNSKKIILR